VNESCTKRVRTVCTSYLEVESTDLQKRTLIGPVVTGQHLDECRLAGAILTE
jgi:hypothetical protein